MSVKLIRRDFAIRTAGFGLAMGLTPAATLAQASGTVCKMQNTSNEGSI
jgi:hypothetical protein